MALFSRRPKKSDDDPSAEALTSAADDPRSPDAETAAPAEQVPHVSISMSTYGRPRSGAEQAAPAPTPPADVPAHLAAATAEASTRIETVPGLRDNVLLRDALAVLPEKAQPTELINVARQLLQGHVYIRVQGDARELLAQGKGLPTSMVTYKDEKYMLVYSGGAALQDAVRADGDAGTSALAQPTIGLLRQVVSGLMGGIAVDQASRPGSALLPKALLEKALADIDPELRIKSLLAAPRTPEIVERVVEALTVAPLWIAARKTETGQVGIAELRAPDGTRMLELFSHPLELLALGRGDQPVKVAAAQLATALRADPGLAGVVVDPAGPWLRLRRDQLHPLLAIGA
ncbi:SseB family protein [Microbacterium caowuchunii]|uniref:SseB family protein n=1 Tax=Microbacterium caowuchunii TaxID=2614638 RepID=UPI001245F4F6|nr:SseB family protein [Microbacterium caowuchunii]QEW00746.1 SseB family protein [Microbacterium caowuchunii]